MKKNTAKFVVKALVCTACATAANNILQYTIRYHAHPVNSLLCSVSALGVGLVVGSYAYREIWNTVDAAMNYISKLEV